MKYVNAYAVTRHYGGPEEGGWYYDSGDPVASIPIGYDHLNTPEELEKSEQQAKELLREVFGLKDDPKNGRRRYSVNGGEDIVICVEDEFAKHYPTERPHYE
jgi:hypothetical protein